MKKLNLQFGILFFLALCLFFVQSVSATTLDSLVYQGTLYDDNGEPIDASLSLKFRIYAEATGGTALWEETRDVTFSKGVFSVALGAETPFEEDLFLNESLFLSVQIETDAESEPRLGLFSVPSAFYAQKATIAESLADGLVITTEQISDDGITSAKISSGAVGDTQLSSTGVVAGTYGSDTEVPQFTVDSKGRVTSVSHVAISLSAADITSVTAGTGLTGGAASGDVTLNVDAGAGANQIVQLNGTGQLPAVDGSLLTNIAPGNDSVTSAKILDGEIVSADLSGAAALTDAQLNDDLTIDGGAIDGTVIGAATPADATFVNGTFASVVIDPTTQDGLLFNPYGVAAGETSELQFLELAANGTNLVGFKAADDLVADVIWTLPSTDGAAGEVLSTDGAGVLSWASDAGGDITSVITNAGSGLTGGATTGDATLSVDMGTGANQIVQLNGSSQLPAVDGSLLTNIAPGNDSVTSAKILDGEIVSADLSASADIADAQVSDTLTASVFKGAGTTTDAVDLATPEVSGVLSDANIPDNITIDLATNATNATNATTADSATTATNADYATTAGSATTATSATTAISATTATTAGSLSADGADCTAGSYAAGVDASGVATGCTAVADFTGLNASNIASGTLANARLTTDVSLLGQTISSAEIVDDAVDGTKIALGSDAQGDIAYYDGTDYVRLGAGLAGQVLKSGGTGANPEWTNSFMTVNVGPFYINDLAGTTTRQATYGYFNTATALSRNVSDMKIQAAAHVIGLYIISDAARTAGTATVRVRIAGTGTTFNSGAVALDATNTTSDSSMVLPGSGLAVTAGQTVGCDVVTVGWTPTMADLQCMLVISYD